jgi:hypothetical protein
VTSSEEFSVSRFPPSGTVKGVVIADALCRRKRGLEGTTVLADEESGAQERVRRGERRAPVTDSLMRDRRRSAATLTSPPLTQ